MTQTDESYAFEKYNIKINNKRCNYGSSLILNDVNLQVKWAWLRF